MDVMSDIEDLMSYKTGCVVIQSGCDVLCSAYDIIHIVAVMSFIHVFDKMDILGVMTQIQWV